MYVDEEIERLGVFFIDVCRMKRGNICNVFCVFIFICIRRESEIIFFNLKNKKRKGYYVLMMMFIYCIMIMNY